MICRFITLHYTKGGEDIHWYSAMGNKTQVAMLLSKGVKVTALSDVCIGEFLIVLHAPI